MNELENIDNGLTLKNINAIREAAEDFTNVTPEEVAELVKNYARQKRQSAFNTKFELSGIDYEAEKEAFLQSYNSDSTRKAYSRALQQLEAFCRKHRAEVLDLTPRQADNFIYGLSDHNSAYVRLIVAADSSFFTFLERRYEVIRNPFRGTRARPKKSASRIQAFPDPEEVAKVLQHIEDPILNTIIFIMADSGLRIGGFCNLTIKDGRFRTTSKGKEYKGRFSPEVLERIKQNGLNLYKPFEGYMKSLCSSPEATESQKTEALKNKIFYELRKLYRKGITEAPYSAHDFRHYYAVREYRKDHDLYRVSKALNHSGIQITEVYLKGLNEIE